MPMNIRNCALVALLFLPFCAWSITVNRCEDAAGNVTFTTLGCPHGHITSQQDADNPPPGSSPAALEPSEYESPTEQRNELIIVGQRDDGCGNTLTADQRRRAIINQQTPTGMTKRDVESLLGKPDKIISRNAEIRYVYKEKKGSSRQVSFDENGCVKGKR